jgi:tRNA threonylcarbamoyl adenosine modification protein YjeE
MFLENVESLRDFAVKFARTLHAGQCVALCGGIGAGKTEFARAVIRSLISKDQNVPSPTFTLVQSYGAGRGGRGFFISHFDLYRVKDEAELEEIGFFDALASGITLIEWPEAAGRFLPPDTIRVRISARGAGREIAVERPGKVQ